jgi:hypothetical protein
MVDSLPRSPFYVYRLHLQQQLSACGLNGQYFISAINPSTMRLPDSLTMITAKHREAILLGYIRPFSYVKI